MFAFKAVRRAAKNGRVGVNADAVAIRLEAAMIVNMMTLLKLYIVLVVSKNIEREVSQRDLREC
jgi:hypothetical protein